ncbi:MAG: hypothetical protein M1815_004975, partial [Lichina confinis]
MLPLVGIGLGLLLVVLVYKLIVFPAWISPLSKIPNAHPTAAISPVWIRWRRRTGRETRSIFAAHSRLGPVVRLGPREISVNSLDGLRTIYLGGFEKDGWYRMFENYGEPNLISMLEHKAHSQQRRVLSNVYSKSFLHRSSDLQTLSSVVVLDRFLPRVDGLASEGAPVDVLELAQSVSMDMISGYIFGSLGGTDFVQDAGYRARWFREYDVFKALPPRDRKGGEIERSCVAMCEAAEASMDEQKERTIIDEDTKPVVYEQFSRRLEPSDRGGPQSESTTHAIASELLDHLIAGHESTGITLVYVMYEMSLRPSLQRRLRDVLLSLSPPLLVDSTTTTTTEPQADGTQQQQQQSTARLPDARDIDSVPLLSAILQETLRLHQAVPAPQPRITPPRSSSSSSSRPISLDGYSDLPGGVRISCNAYALHRNAQVFPEPDVWDPERWLQPDKLHETEMRRWFWAFGSGSRMCLGNHFAVQ